MRFWGRNAHNHKDFIGSDFRCPLPRGPRRLRSAAPLRTLRVQPFRCGDQSNADGDWRGSDRPAEQPAITSFRISRLVLIGSEVAKKGFQQVRTNRHCAAGRDQSDRRCQSDGGRGERAGIGRGKRGRGGNAQHLHQDDVTNQQVAEMPSQRTRCSRLIFLNGMANFPGVGSYTSVRNYPTVVVSVAGGNGDAVTYMLDGSMWRDPYNSLSLPLPFPDALQEFKVETSAMSAQYGYHASATVNASLNPAPTNITAILFEFLRNGDLNARDFFAFTRDTLKQKSVRRRCGQACAASFQEQTLLLWRGAENFAAIGLVPRTSPLFRQASLGGDFTALASPALQPAGRSRCQRLSGSRITPFHPRCSIRWR